MKVYRLMNSTVGAACILLAAATLRGDDPINLWPDNSPELKGVDQKHIPTLHWLRQLKDGAPPGSKRAEDLLFGPRTMGHGSF
jgi:hypothetical protein